MGKFKELERSVIDAIPDDIFCAAVNIKNRIKRRPYRLRLERQADKTFYIAEDDSARIVFCRRPRHKRYVRGVFAGTEDLARQYNLDKITVQPGGIFIDCGANIGELGLWARSLGFTYIAIEPEALEADCVDANNFDGAPQTNRVALWHEDTTLQFYSKPDSADSSAFDMGDAAVVEVPARRLDNLVDLSPSRGTNVLKLEAEGAEPEVLEGAEITLKQIDYVAVDCGYERGAEKRHTFIEVHRHLSERGFEPIEAEFRRVTFLYKNTNR